MPSKFHVGNALLAEYVTQGSNNKHMIVNAYSGDVIVQKFPADLTFGVYIEIQQPLPEHFEVELSYGGGALFRGQATAINPEKSASSVFVIPMFQVPAKEEGHIELTVSAPGFSKAKVISKRVFASNPSPIASQPPSEQSPPAAPAS